MLIRKPLTFPSSGKLLTNPSGQTHPLVIKTNPCISDMAGFRRHLPEKQPILSPIQGERLLYQVTSRPGRSGLDDVIEGHLIHFGVL